MKIFKQLVKENARWKGDKTNEIIEAFQERIIETLGNNLDGIYLIGSFALNDFSPKLSDIDFIVSIKNQLQTTDLQQIETFHKEIEQIAIRPNLNGIYLLENKIGKLSKDIQQLTYYHEGELNTVYNKSSYYEINPITWAELKLHGLTLQGKKIEELKFDFEWKEVDDYMYKNINSYWSKWLKQSNNPFHQYYYSTLLRPSENAWCVSGVARQLYSLIEEEITSKRLACEYFLEKAPLEFVSILTDTISFRQGQSTRKGWLQKKKMRAFLRYGIDRFNDVYKQKYLS